MPFNASDYKKKKNYGGVLNYCLAMQTHPCYLHQCHGTLVKNNGESEQKGK